MSRRWRRSLDRQAVRPDDDRARLERVIELALREDQRPRPHQWPPKPLEGPAVLVVGRKMK